MRLKTLREFIVSGFGAGKNKNGEIQNLINSIAKDEKTHTLEGYVTSLALDIEMNSQKDVVNVFVHRKKTVVMISSDLNIKLSGNVSQSGKAENGTPILLSKNSKYSTKNKSAISLLNVSSALKDAKEKECIEFSQALISMDSYDNDLKKDEVEKIVERLTNFSELTNRDANRNT